MLRFLQALPLSAVMLVSACSIVAPAYSPSIPNVQRLKDVGAFSAKVGTFSADAEAHDSGISLRGSSLKSPINGSYASYLADALRQELSMAGKLAPDAQLEISGTVNKNDLDASGFSKGYGGIDARFVVKRGGNVRYDAIKSAKTEWDSSFMGAVAIPNAQAAYPNLVQQLLAQLYADPQFVNALK